MLVLANMDEGKYWFGSGKYEYGYCLIAYKLQGQNICYDMSCIFPMHQIIHCIYLNNNKHIADDMKCKDPL